jgi:hypothetical protein
MFGEVGGQEDVPVIAVLQLEGPSSQLDGCVEGEAGDEVVMRTEMKFNAKADGFKMTPRFSNDHSGHWHQSWKVLPR